MSGLNQSIYSRLTVSESHVVKKEEKNPNAKRPDTGPEGLSDPSDDPFTLH